MKRREIVFTVAVLAFLITSSVRAAVLKHGDLIRLKHVETGANLHSHPHNYSASPGFRAGSRQQQVTAYLGEDHNDIWQILCDPEALKNGKAELADGSLVRLLHVGTGKYLHSHLIHAPVTDGQQEVSCYGGGSVTDQNDSWIVWTENEKGEKWETGKKVKLHHRETQRSLHSHPVQSNWPNQLEVTATEANDKNDWWIANHAPYNPPSPTPPPAGTPGPAGPNPPPIASPGKSVHFKSGTAKFGGSITLFNPSTGKTEKKMLDADYDESRCAAMLWIIAGNLGLRRDLAGQTVRIYSPDVHIQVVGAFVDIKKF